MNFHRDLRSQAQPQQRDKKEPSWAIIPVLEGGGSLPP